MQLFSADDTIFVLFFPLKTWKNRPQKYMAYFSIPYACHYNRRFVYFKPTFLKVKKKFKEDFSDNSRDSRAGYDDTRTVIDFVSLTAINGPNSIIHFSKCDL